MVRRGMPRDLCGLPQRDALSVLMCRSVLSGSLGEECLLPALHVLRSHVFNVRGDAPLLAERVGKLSVAVAPERKFTCYLHIVAASQHLQRKSGTRAETVRK
jgi:hypothetical protein